MTIGSRRVRLEFFSLPTTRVVNHSRFLRTTTFAPFTIFDQLQSDAACAGTYLSPRFEQPARPINRGVRAPTIGAGKYQEEEQRVP